MKIAIDYNLATHHERQESVKRLANSLAPEYKLVVTSCSANYFESRSKIESSPSPLKRAIETYRAETDLENLGTDSDVFDDVRDTSPGREFDF